MSRSPRLPNTSAYLALREQSQALFDFAVLTVIFGVPMAEVLMRGAVYDNNSEPVQRVRH